MTANGTGQPMLVPGELEVGDNGAVTQTLWQPTYGDLIVGDRIFQQGWCTVTELQDARRGKRRITADKMGSPRRFAEWPTTPVTFGQLVRPVDRAAELVRTAELAQQPGHVVDAEQGQAVLLCPRCRQPVSVDLVVDLGDQVPAGRAGVNERLHWALVAHLQSYCRASARYAWVCDTDHSTPHGEPGTRAGLTGPRWAAGPLLRRLEAGQGTRWRTLYDEDEDVPLAERLVHSGRILMGDDAPGAAQFGPLDDLSRPDCGAGEIQYLEHGVWKPL